MENRASDYSQPTPANVAFAAGIRARDAAIRKWLGKRCSYKPEELPAELSPSPTNEERTRAECIEFRARPLPFGESYTAYLHRDEPHAMPLCDGLHVTHRITTFMGDTLAFVTHITMRKVRGGYLTNERGSFWARGIDGRIYHGRHNGAGVYCRMRLAKHQ